MEMALAQSPEVPLQVEVRTFAVTAGLAPETLLKLIEKWRDLQSGSSLTKSPVYSQES